MERLSALLALIAGCGFSAQAPSNPGGADANRTDAAVPGDASVVVDGAAPCVPGFLDLCKQAAPSITLDITTTQLINTDTDPRCRTVTQPGGGDVCLVYATRVSIAATGSLAASGKRPLAIASSSTLTIDGTLDVGSHGAQRGPAVDATGCNFASIPATDTGGGGGAAGGSFTLAGGDGGTGDSNNNGLPAGTASPGTHGTTTTIGVLRGGCAGQTGGDEGGGGGNGGVGGHSGGALYLFARQGLEIKGNVRATGEGGRGGDGMAGGGGGGTGGMVVIESPSITISGQLSANAGGGGQGGGKDNGNKRVPGRSGTDGNLGTTAAAGGSGALGGDPGFGLGGAGGAITAAVGGATGSYGGGGGGGAAGAIKLVGTTQLSGSTISPAPQ